MNTVTYGLVAAVIGAALGIWVRHLLASLNYRHDDERELPDPGPRTWIIWASALSLGGITAWLEATGSWSLAPVLLPLTLAGPALAAIDLDVMRLPNVIVGPVAALTIASLAFTSTSLGDGTTALRGAAAGGLAAGTLWVLHAITHGGVGFGDVKLAGITGIAAGAINLATAWWALAIGTLAALAWTATTRSTGRPFAYSPWMLAGTWGAILISAS